MNNKAILIMAKAPLPGFVKTRLEGRLTPVQCARLYECFLFDVIDCAMESGFKVNIALTPGELVGAINNQVPPSVYVFPQEGCDLGQRMSSAAEHLFGRGCRRCVIIGADIPTIQPGRLKLAMTSLETHDTCIGPACDGGYYLVGLNRPCPELFAGITWGTDQVLQETEDRLQRLGMTGLLLPELNDIDCWDDLVRLYEEFDDKELLREREPMRTKKFLKSVFSEA